MAEQRRGLGRGLSALLDENPGGGEDAPTGGVRELPIELVDRNPKQPRMDFDGDELNILAASIRDKGILQPILVRIAPDKPGQYQIVAGERRWRAAQIANLKMIPALIKDLDDLETLEIGIIENIQRIDLNPYEEAASYKALIDRFGRTQEQIAALTAALNHAASILEGATK